MPLCLGVWVYFIAVSSYSLIFTSTSSSCYWTPRVYFSVQLYWTGTFLYFLSLKVLTMFIHSSLSLMNIFMTFALNFLSLVCYYLCLSQLFFWVCYVLWFRTCFFVSSICLSLCLYILGETATSSSPEGVALYRRWSMGPKVQSSLTTRARCSRGAVPTHDLWQGQLQC